MQNAYSIDMKDAPVEVEALASPATPSPSAAANYDFAVESTGRSRRIPALDFTKGALVLIMVLYHWLNYFVTADGSVYKYLRFLTPSFIFITGLLISHVYRTKYQAMSQRISRRLAVRGLKLLGNCIVSESDC